MSLPLILPRLGRWSLAAGTRYIWRRLYLGGRWTPLCVVSLRYARRVPALSLLSAVLALAGCAYVARPGVGLTTDVLASAQRELDNAPALREAAATALRAGDRDGCLRYARLAVRAETVALPAARRALWLAGLAYPGGDRETDPGPIPEVDPAAVEAMCYEVPPAPVVPAPAPVEAAPVAPQEAP